MDTKNTTSNTEENHPSGEKSGKKPKAKTDTPDLEKEIGGYEAQNLPEPTRYGDWEVKGRCSDF